jgi:hypothetical protein
MLLNVEVSQVRHHDDTPQKIISTTDMMQKKITRCNDACEEKLPSLPFSLMPVKLPSLPIFIDSSLTLPPRFCFFW